MARADLLGIGEFSKAVGVTVKALRLYHERGLLLPARIDASTGYRYYDARSAERARAIVLLRGLDFSLDQIADILGSIREEEDWLAHLERHRRAIEDRLEHYSKLKRALDDAIAAERRAQDLAACAAMPEWREVKPIWVAGIRARGDYGQTGRRIGEVARRLGRAAAGAPLNLYYEQEYRDGDADFETCFPVERRIAADGLEVHELAGGACWSLVHRGAYGHIGRTYERMFRHLREVGAQPAFPMRELYIKGPGMLLRGNPDKYLTEIQVFVDGADGPKAE